MTANGNAFMECPEVKACFGKDAFIHSSVLLQCGLEGTEVIRFNLHINHAGMPQVSAPVWVRISDAWPTPSFAQSSQNVVGNASGGGFLGTVKEADPSKGYSVITATDQSNPQDVCDSSTVAFVGFLPDGTNPRSVPAFDPTHPSTRTRIRLFALSPDFGTNADGGGTHWRRRVVGVLIREDPHETCCRADCVGDAPLLTGSSWTHVFRDTRLSSHPHQAGSCGRTEKCKT